MAPFAKVDGLCSGSGSTSRQTGLLTRLPVRFAATDQYCQRCRKMSLLLKLARPFPRPFLRLRHHQVIVSASRTARLSSRSMPLMESLSRKVCLTVLSELSTCQL